MKTIQAGDKTLALPPYELGSRVLYESRPGTVVGINLIGEPHQRLRIWWDSATHNGFTCGLDHVEPLSAVDRLGDLAP